MYAARPLLERPAPASAPVTAPTDSSTAPQPMPPSATAPAASTPPTTSPATNLPEPAPATPSPPEADRALDAVRKGEFQPLDAITVMLAERFPGQILGVKLSEDDGLTVYEFRILTKAGRLMEVEVDPRSGRVVDVDEDDD